MADSFGPDQNRAASTVPLVPPSSSEVVIRTMASDLAAIGRSGGLPATGPIAMRMPAGVPVPAPGGDKKALRAVIVTLMIIVGALLLFGLGFYVLPKFLG